MQRWLLYICSVLITWSTSSTCRTEIKAPEVGVWRAQKDEATDANKEWNQFMVISLMSPVVWWERTNEFSAQPTNHVACLWLQTVVPLMVGNNFLNQQSGLFVCVFIELKKNLFGWGFNERCDPPLPPPSPSCNKLNKVFKLRFYLDSSCSCLFPLSLSVICLTRRWNQWAPCSCNTLIIISDSAHYLTNPLLSRSLTKL